MTCLRKGVCASPWLAEFALARLSHPGLGIVGFSEARELTLGMSVEDVVVSA